MLKNNERTTFYKHKILTINTICLSDFKNLTDTDMLINYYRLKAIGLAPTASRLKITRKSDPNNKELTNE